MGMLPAAFADLEVWTAWCLPTEAERYARRLASTMEEMQAFYDAIVPRGGAAIAYCEGFDLEDLPDDVLNLLHLLYSMVMVSFPVEVWHQPRIPDSGNATLDCVAEPTP
jgi:hypothetical protein